MIYTSNSSGAHMISAKWTEVRSSAENVTICEWWKWESVDPKEMPRKLCSQKNPHIFMLVPKTRIEAAKAIQEMNSDFFWIVTNTWATPGCQAPLRFLLPGFGFSQWFIISNTCFFRTELRLNCCSNQCSVSILCRTNWSRFSDQSARFTGRFYAGPKVKWSCYIVDTVFSHPGKESINFYN